MTQILRHRAVDLGITIRSDGFCRLREVMSVSWLKDIGCKMDDVDRVVRESDKKRFEVQVVDGEQWVRAVQGHSIKQVSDDQLLRRLEHTDTDLPQRCVHGTYRRHVKNILAKGLIAGGGAGQGFRNHIHFAPFEPGDERVVSGMRYDCEVGIWLDLKLALREGVPFFLSNNQVILSPGNDGHIPSKYFQKVKDLRDMKVLWSRGKKSRDGQTMY